VLSVTDTAHVVLFDPTILALVEPSVGGDYSSTEGALNLLHYGHNGVLILVLQDLLGTLCYHYFIVYAFVLFAFHTIVQF
jgi:hypothetical protein